MFAKIISFLILLFALIFAVIWVDGYNRDRKYNGKLDELSDHIRIGDDIFEAKYELEKHGFDIKYGPDFPAKDESYFLMIVDFGINPSPLEEFKNALGMDFTGRQRSAEIRATTARKVISIE